MPALVVQEVAEGLRRHWTDLCDQLSLVTMTNMYNVGEAKAHLSRLLEEVLAGDEVVLAKAGRPVARLVAIARPSARELGFLPVAMPDERFDPLDDDELVTWQ